MVLNFPKDLVSIYFQNYSFSSPLFLRNKGTKKMKTNKFFLDTKPEGFGDKKRNQRSFIWF